MSKVEVPRVNIDALRNFSLSEMGNISAGGTPLMLPLTDIEEDPNNVRREFAEEGLQELSKSIVATGRVLEPISVRQPNDEGKYVINSGARRFRAAKLAGLEEIAAFIDDQADEFARFIVNEQRENLSPMDVANFIAKQTGKLTHEKIADRIGKSRQYVSQHAALIALPPSLRGLYDTDVCRSPTALSELARLHKKAPDVVDVAVANAKEITAALFESIKTVIAELENPGKPKIKENKEHSEKGATKETEKSKGLAIQITVKHKDKTYRLLGDFVVPRKPRGDKAVFIVKGREEPIAVPFEDLELDSVIFK